MTEEENYVKRLENIIDKQDDLLTHFDAKFDQQQSLYDNLTKENSMLKEDIKKHKDLLTDKNIQIDELKKELEQQLKIQEDLHTDYDKVIKELTDELEEEKNKNNLDSEKHDEVKEIEKESNNVELPSEEDEKDPITSTSNEINDVKEESFDVVNNTSNQNNPANDEIKKDNAFKDKFCKNCGAKVREGYIFCDSCGTKLE